MTIFKNEFKQLLSSMLVWSIVLGILIFLMTPVYVDMLTSADMSAMGDLANTGYYEALGTNIEMMTTSIGAYAFLTTFVLFACAIHGMNIGLSIMTKEYRCAAADFLLTKPYSRSRIFFAKLFAGLAVTLVVGLAYLMGSWAGMEAGAKGDYSALPMVLIACSTILIQWIFLVLGMLIGVLFPNLRTTITISSGVTFFTFVTGSFSYKMGYALLGYFSPFTYFKSADIITSHQYQPISLLVYAVGSVVIIYVGHKIFRNKDIILVV